MPPKQFFSPLVLEKLKPDRLWTLPTHEDCNKSYERDEQYTVTTLAPFARDSWAGGALNIDNIRKFTRGDRGAKLFAKIYGEYSWKHVGGPGWQGMVAADKSVEMDRVTRVCWKVIRGLHFREQQTVLLESARGSSQSLFSIDDEMIESWWAKVPGAGIYPYPQVLDYRFMRELEPETAYERWALLLLWERVVWVTNFRDGA